MILLFLQHFRPYLFQYFGGSLIIRLCSFCNTGTTSQLLDGLSSRRFDLIFASQPPADLGLTSIPVSRQDLVLITPRKHPLAQFHTIDLAQTIPYPQVYFAKGSGLRYVIDGLYRQIGQEPQIAYETEEDSVIAGLVAHGFGIAVVPYMEILHRLDVKIMQISNPAWERNFYLVSNDRSYLTPAAREFRQFIVCNYQYRSCIVDKSTYNRI